MRSLRHFAKNAGADKGGILVRDGESTSSTQLSARLSDWNSQELLFFLPSLPLSLFFCVVVVVVVVVVVGCCGCCGGGGGGGCGCGCGGGGCGCCCGGCCCGCCCCCCCGCCCCCCCCCFVVCRCWWCNFTDGTRRFQVGVAKGPLYEKPLDYVLIYVILLCFSCFMSSVSANSACSRASKQPGLEGTGAKVEQLELKGQRLHYRLKTGHVVQSGT